MYLLFVLIFILKITPNTCTHFDIDNIQILRLQDPNIYFGYSLLLQKNHPTSVIVGAPKQIKDNPKGGSLYRCDLKYNNCTLFDGIADLKKLSKIGNWLGSVVDGEETNERTVFTCAPRHILVDFHRTSYSPNGECLEIDYFGRITEIDPLRKENQLGHKSVYYLNCSHAQLGFDMQYLPNEENYLVFGAPGLEQWEGGIIIKSRSGIKILPLNSKTLSLTYEYLGYSVRGARFTKNAKHVWYVAGAPRSTNFFGKVEVFRYNPNSYTKITTINTIIGEEFGSYFGASLLVEDLNGDGIKDLLIGAPTGTGKTYDEGYVYYFQFNGKFKRKSILFGSKATGARFGSVLTSLGDINLDGFNDIAIAAPYENDGEGAVYVYTGSKDNLVYSERISPQIVQKTIPGSGFIKGFGLGLSKGSDLDDNGFNDFAVGAYLSNTVFIFKTKPILDYKLSIKSDLMTLQRNSSEFLINYCVEFKWRSNKLRNGFEVFNFNTSIQLDPRGITQDTLKSTIFVNYKHAISHCKNISITLKQSSIFLDITTPFEIHLNGTLIEKNISAYGEDVRLSIPFSHGCGNDNLCQPILNLSANILNSDITVGDNKEINIDLHIVNTGEPAYQCELFINANKYIEFRNTQNCYTNSDGFVCVVNDVILNSKSFLLLFDIKEYVNPKLDFLSISFAVKSLDGSSATLQVDVPIKFISTPYISGISNPLQLDYPNSQEINEITHLFNLGNSGPSPINLENVKIFVPQPRDKNGEPIIRIADAKNYVNNMENLCHVKTHNSTEMDPIFNVLDINTVDINCFQENVHCLEIICEDGGYVIKGETSLLYIKLLINLKLLSNTFNEQSSVDLIKITSNINFMDNNEIISTNSATSIFIANEQLVPFWILIAAPISGVLLLIALIFILYKCNFFKRNYREKLKNEILSESLINVEK